MTATLVSAWADARRRLAAAGVDSPVIDARLLLEAAAGARRVDIVSDPHRALTGEQSAGLEGYLARREAREPVSHILGAKGFWKITLRVTPDVLTPRPDSETILDVVLPLFGERDAFRLLDLGVGSGALLLAILAERPGATGVGVDASEAALAVARGNAAELNLAERSVFLHGDWASDLEDDGFDLVACNPPYIPSGDISALDPEVRDHEPRAALDGGADGLEAYRAIAPQILRVLRPGGVFAVEVGVGQRTAVESLFAAAGAEGLRVAHDLAGRERVVVGNKKDLGKMARSG